MVDRVVFEVKVLAKTNPVVRGDVPGKGLNVVWSQCHQLFEAGLATHKKLLSVFYRWAKDWRAFHVMRWFSLTI